MPASYTDVAIDNSLSPVATVVTTDEILDVWRP
ncbi:hypothetical protein FAGKG844_270027 [Frankia sp. AgKG'84/4]